MSIQIPLFVVSKLKLNVAWTRIEENFDTLFSTRESIGNLRNLILELAFRGELVDMEPGDSSAPDLVAQIEAAWASRKRKEVLPEVGERERPSSPSGWAWVRLGNLAEVVGGVTKGRDLKGRKVRAFPYLRVANVQRGYLDLDEIKEIEIPEEELAKYRLVAGDILFTEGGDWDKLGRSSIWAGQIDCCVHQNHVFRARMVSPLLDPRWFSLFGNSPVGRRYFEDAAKQTTNLASINMTQLRHCPMPLPPLAEQKRIVAKVDQLMALCDELEARQTKKRETGTRLTKSALEALTSAEGPEEFDVAWKRVVENFDVLIDRADKVGELRELAVDLAMTGKLSRKAECWKRVRLGDAATLRTGFAVKSPDYVAHGTFVLRVTNIAPDGKISKESDAVFFPEEKIDEKVSKHLLREGELLVVMVGGSLGKVGIVPRSVLPALLNQNMWRVNANADVLSQRFLFHLLRYINRKKARVTQSTHGHLAMGEYIEEILAIPSVDEQERLASVIEELMRLCDDLEAKLHRAENRASKLVEAVVSELVA